MLYLCSAKGRKMWYFPFEQNAKTSPAHRGRGLSIHFTSGRMPSSTSGSVPVLVMEWLWPSGQ